MPWLFETLCLAPVPGINTSSRSIPQLCLSLTKAMGSSAKWLCHGQVGQKYFPAVFETLSVCLTDPLYQLQAAESLRDILSKCGYLPGSHTEAMKIHTFLLSARAGTGGVTITFT